MSFTDPQFPTRPDHPHLPVPAPSTLHSALCTPFSCPNSEIRSLSHPFPLCPAPPPAFTGLIFSPWATRRKLLCPSCLLHFSRQINPFAPTSPLSITSLAAARRGDSPSRPVRPGLGGSPLQISLSHSAGLPPPTTSPLSRSVGRGDGGEG